MMYMYDAAIICINIKVYNDVIFLLMFDEVVYMYNDVNIHY